MQELAEKVEYSRPIMEYGYVQEAGERYFSVLTSYGGVISERAVSCLVQPEAGDTVLLSVDMSGNAFILSVLKRDVTEGMETDIVFDGPVNVQVKGGDLSLTSDIGMTIAAGEGLSFAGQKISVDADEGAAKISKLEFIGTFLDSQIKKVKHVADTVDTVYRRLTERLVNAVRFVKEEEEVQTGSTRYLVEDTLTMHSKNAVHMAEEIVTINAEQVHLG
ncbi:MAG: DUF3540 domain-containing protein [Thermodesulfobacteriota bacterium]|nr:DUF3540 domain-containing protein [Thermodesulfobacteriota bacterium]